LHPDLKPSAEWVQKLEAAGMATRPIAEVLGQFVNQLIEQGFTEDGAERLADTLMIAMLE
jgi:hypothetical protein